MATGLSFFKTKKVYVILALAFVGSGCAQGPASLNWGPAGVRTSSLSSTASGDSESKALAILQTNCASCHTATSGPAGIYGLGDPAHMVSAGLIVPGQPAQSLIYNAIDSGAMPPGNRLSAGDELAIADWITDTGGGGGTTPPAATPTPVPSATPAATATFASLKSTIFTPKCVGCHSTASKAGGYAFDTYAGVVAGVNKTKPTSSIIYTDTLSGKMPKNGTPLTATQLALLLQWIQAGAPNN